MPAILQHFDKKIIYYIIRIGIKAGWSHRANGKEGLKKRMKQRIRGILFAAAAIVLCLSAQNTGNAKVKVSKVTVKSNYGKSVHVAVGKSIKLTTTVKVSPSKAANKKVTYKSSNKKIAKVTSGGTVKGVRTGKCKVTVTSKKNKKKKAKITVYVVKKVTSITIEKPKDALYVGNSLTLKATVNPASGSYKKVIWKSSNTSIATVSSSGVVKGIKAGDVTIKATSVEGTKKSASIRLTILATNSVSIASVEVLSENAVRVVLDKVMALTDKQFLIEGKRYVSGTYNRKYTISQIRNYDNRTYDLTLSPEYTVERDSYVRVTIPELPGNGVKAKESQAAFVRTAGPNDAKWLGVVGDKWEKTVDLSEYGYGHITYQIMGSVPGITCKVRNNCLVFCGELTTVTVGTDIIIKATDEMGSTFTHIIHVYVGNASTVVAKAEDLTVVTGGELTDREFASALGGSGNYTFSEIGLPSGLKLDETDGTLSGKATGIGEYKVWITVTDQENPARTFQASAQVKVVDQKRVIGKVCDTKGNPVADADITCENRTDGSLYTVKTDAEGAYTLYVGEGSYDITAAFAEKTDAVYNIAVGSGGRQINFMLETD